MNTKKTPAKRTDYANDTRMIKVVIKNNPHRENTHRYDAFEAIRSSKTVAAYAATGNKPKYLKAWKASGHIAFVRPVKAKASTTVEATK